MATTEIGTVSFARGVPAPECLPVDELAECVRTVLAQDGRTILSYGTGAGYAPLREVIGTWFDVEPERVLLTNGSLQGFVLLTQQLVRGGTVLVEEPTYDRPLKILREAGATIHSVALDEEGLEPASLERALAGQPDVAFLYTIPTFQNPSGNTMSLERRHDVLKLAQASSTLVLEDDPYSLIRFEGERLPSLFELAGGADGIIYSSSFSKTVAPGIRVGFFVLPRDLATSLTEAANSTYISPVLLGQAAVYEFIRRGSFEPNLERVNRLLGGRRDAMLEALEEHFGGTGATWSRPQGGYFVWLELPEGASAQDVLARAEGVTALPGTDFGGSENALRLAFSFISPEEIGVGVERLAAAASI